MNILLTGSSGQLGREMQACLAGSGTVTRVDRQPDDNGTRALDLADLAAVDDLLDRVRPEVVINAAAYTAVDQAESDHQTAFRINAELPASLARWCRRNDAFLLHYSTDYVFSGHSSRPYIEGDAPGPQGVYGASKLAGEWAVGASECRHIVLRTSWVYSTHGTNFVLNMLRLARQRPELSVVSDQTGCPTWARNLAQASFSALCQSLENPADASRRGVFHYCDASVVSWHDFASLIFTLAAELHLLHEIPRLKSIRSKDYPQVARRPEYSVLDTTAFRRAFRIEPPDLKASLRACLEELQA